jgi:hypothetical protein
MVFEDIRSGEVTTVPMLGILLNRMPRTLPLDQGSRQLPSGTMPQCRLCRRDNVDVWVEFVGKDSSDTVRPGDVHPPSPGRANYLFLQKNSVGWLAFAKPRRLEVCPSPPPQDDHA